jgi:hypothetical protein
MLGATEVGQMPALHAVVVIADAYGGHTDTWGDDEVYCPSCGWRRSLPPDGPSAWEVSNEHLLDVAVPVLVASGDLADADVPAFRQRAPCVPGSLDALLTELPDHRNAQQPAAQSVSAALVSGSGS